MVNRYSNYLMNLVWIKCDLAQEASKMQQWPGKTALWEETWSRSTLEGRHPSLTSWVEKGERGKWGGVRDREREEESQIDETRKLGRQR